MKIIWTAEQVNPGIIVTKPGCNERWMIGYAPFAKTIDGERDDKARYTLNSMIDGLVMEPVTREVLAQKLTDGNKLPVEIIDNPRFGFPKVAP
jgi:hypothetical protein